MVVVLTTTAKRQKKLTLGQECGPDQDEEDNFKELFDKELDDMLADAATMGFGAKGSSLVKGSLAKGKGKDGRQKEQLALEDLPKTEEELMEDALAKARKLRNLIGTTLGDFEEAYTSFRKTKFCTAKARHDAESVQDNLKSSEKRIKKNSCLEKQLPMMRPKQCCWRLPPLSKRLRLRSRSSST